MRLESKALLWDMHRAASLVAAFTGGRSEQDLGTDDMLRSAVERQFEIVGEALTQLRKIDAPAAERITDHRQIIGFRNVLIHGYRTVSNAITWRIVQDHLPVLLKELDAMLAEPDVQG